MENDLIQRDEALKILAIDTERIIGHTSYKDRALLNIRGLPAVDAVEVVRCADCRHFTCGANDAEQWAWCNWREQDVDPTDYCSWGQRREEEHNAVD